MSSEPHYDQADLLHEFPPSGAARWPPLTGGLVDYRTSFSGPLTRPRLTEDVEVRVYRPPRLVRLTVDRS